MRSPLWELSKALYTVLDAVTGLTAYSFVPDSVSYPYVYIGRKRSRPQYGNKDNTRHVVEVQLLIVTNDQDISVAEGLIDDVETAMGSILTLAGDWQVAIQTEVPNVDVYSGKTTDGAEGHVVEASYSFNIVDIS